MIARWLHDLDAIAVLDEASVSLVRERVREQGAAAKLPPDATASLVTAASELAHNQLAHARGGRVAVRIVRRGADDGVEVIAADAGEGLLDPLAALRGRTGEPRPDASSLGIGLAGVVSLADEVDFDVRLGEGTCVWARKFATQVRRKSVGIFGRAIEGERVSGDDAGFVREGGELLVAVADGLGHGPDARHAATLAVDAALARPLVSLDEAIETVHEHLHKTRGAVLALSRVLDRGGFETSVAGNVVVQVFGRGATSRRHAGVSRALGLPGQARRARVEQDTLGALEILVVYSDGLSSHVTLSGDVLLHAPPIVVAQHLVERFATSRDDVLVAVVS